MQTRVAVMSIILEDNAHAEEINDILHLYGRYIIGRMGLPLQTEKYQHHLCGGGCPTGCHQCHGGKARARARRQHQNGVFQFHEHRAGNQNGVIRKND